MWSEISVVLDLAGCSQISRLTRHLADTLQRMKSMSRVGVSLLTAGSEHDRGRHLILALLRPAASSLFPSGSDSERAKRKKEREKSKNQNENSAGTVSQNVSVSDHRSDAAVHCTPSSTTAPQSFLCRTVHRNGT